MHLFADETTASQGSRARSSGSAPNALIESSRSLRPFSAVTAAISSTGFRMPDEVSQCTSTTCVMAGSAVQRGCDFGGARGKVVALVDQLVRPVHIAQRLRNPQAVGAVRQHQRLAVARDEAAEHRLDGERAAALHRHALPVVGPAGDGDEPTAKLRRHCPEVTIPGPPVAQHRLLDLERCGQRARRQQERLAGGRVREGRRVGLSLDQHCPAPPLPRPSVSIPKSASASCSGRRHL